MDSPARRNKRPLDADTELRDSKRRLTTAMDALRIGPAAATSLEVSEWRAPFGARPRLRATRNDIPHASTPLAFGTSFKRALETAAETASDESTPLVPPKKRARKSDSRALVVYRPRGGVADTLYTPGQHVDAWLSRQLARRTVEATFAAAPDVEQKEEVQPMLGDTDPDVDMELIIDEHGAVVPASSRALIVVPSAASRRREQYARAAQRARSLVHTQTVILAPWLDSDVDME